MSFLFLFSAVGNTATGDETQQNIQRLVLLLVITLAVALISRPLRLPYTLVLVVAGLIIGFSPLLPDIRLESDVVLFLFLPAFPLTALEKRRAVIFRYSFHKFRSNSEA